MPRAIWKGAISFGLVTVPVALYVASDWDPRRYRDTYHEVLREAIAQKAQGKEVALPAPKKPARVVSLARALEQSLKTPRREPAKAAGRRHATTAHRGRRAHKRAA